MIKAIKKFGTTIIVLSFMTITFTGCGKKNIEDEVYIAGTDFSDSIKLKDYTGLDIEYEFEATDIDDNYISERLEYYREIMSEQMLSERKVTNENDTIQLSIETKIDGEIDNNFTASNTTYTIGNDMLAKQLNDELVGKEVGKEYSLEYSFEDDYSNNEYVGKQAISTYTINSIIDVSKPELNDEFAKKFADAYDVADVTDIESLKNYIVASGNGTNQQTEQTTKENAIYNNTSIFGEVNKYDEKEMETVKKQLKDTMEKQYEQYKEYYDIKSFDSFLLTYYGIGLDSNTTLDSYLDTYSKYYCQQYMIFYTIASKENIYLTKEEFDTCTNKLAEQYNLDSYDELLKQMTENDNTFSTEELDNNLKKEALVEKVVAWLVDNNNMINKA